uniref:Peptidyl-prolyl cis-trans isomerase n=1 Tax=Guillardia theta (strain CCMP2712) TaxID=905079 RepID=A0A0C3UDT9_GUITC
MVLLTTTMGEIDIELWSKEAPLACRNFIQLCMEGYYDNTMFHRIIPKFMVQGGDPTGTGSGGESVYGETFKDEIHSRLRFSVRGLVAMANGGRNDNGSQFFMTLAPCEWLNGKHTIFGKVTGKTIFNLDAMGASECDQDDRPLYPPRILSTEVLLNPFDDIIPREVAPKQQEEEKPKVVLCLD